MKTDTRDDALSVAKRLSNAEADQIADALLEAHLEGIDQGRSLILQGKSLDEVRTQVQRRREFILSAISNKEIRSQLGQPLHI